MGQLSAFNKFLDALKSFFSIVGLFLKRVGTWINDLRKKIWAWSRVNVPFVEAFVQRHIKSPSTVFIDLSIFILAVYVFFGLTGYVLIYQKDSEGRFSETISELYPLPAARVDNSFIWSHKFLSRLRFLNTFNAQAPAGTAKPPTDDELRGQVLDGLVEDKIILLEAQKRGLRVTQSELDDAYNQQKQQTDNYEEKIHQLYGMTVPEFKEVLAEEILREKVKAVVLERVRIRHILTTTLDSANAAKAELDSGKDFAAVAKEYSQDAQTKDTGGDLGYWTKDELKDQISPEVEAAAFSLNVNQISGAIPSKYGYHIIQVTEKTGENYESYAEWLDGVKKTYKIKEYLPI